MALRERMVDWWERLGQAPEGIDDPPQARSEGRVVELEAVVAGMRGGAGTSSSTQIGQVR